ncbi:MAG TPA: hypothetical protein VKR61_07390 [Bryobacteraceae bacterium]|nr:hypothetical protein [Bryobacteraceae bacterium]
MGAAVQPAKPGKHPPDLESLIAGAVMLPVECQSDILFDLIDKGKLPDRAAKAHLLEDVFPHAGEAGNPHAKVDHPEHFDTLSRIRPEARYPVHSMPRGAADLERFREEGGRIIRAHRARR